MVITVNPTYLFNEDSLSTTIIAEKPFTYYVRIPEWSHNATISVNGGAALPCTPTDGLHAVSVNAGTNNLTLTLPADIMFGSSCLLPLLHLARPHDPHCAYRRAPRGTRDSPLQPAALCLRCHRIHQPVYHTYVISN